MSFVDPLGFSSYAAISPAYPMQPMMEPAVSPFGAFDPAMSSFGAFDLMSAFGAVDPMMSSFGSYSPAMSSYMGIQPQCYPPRSPYGPMSPPYSDPSGGLSGMMGQLMQMFMSLFSGMNEPSVEPPIDELGGEIPEEEVPVDNREQKIERLDPQESNEDALEVLSIYSRELGAKGGLLTKDALEDFIDYGAAEKGVPEKVKQAAEILRDNETLFNLLCIESGSTAEEGFSLSALNTQWEDDMDIETLYSVSSKEKAVEILIEHKAEIGTLSQQPGETTNTYLSKEDLEAVALGETDLGLNEREAAKVQAAALKILNDEETWEEIDTIDANGGFSNAEDDYIDGPSLDHWLARND